MSSSPSSRVKSAVRDLHSPNHGWTQVEGFADMLSTLALQELKHVLLSWLREASRYVARSILSCS